MRQAPARAGAAVARCSPTSLSRYQSKEGATATTGSRIRRRRCGHALEAVSAMDAPTRFPLGTRGLENLAVRLGAVTRSSS